MHSLIISQRLTNACIACPQQWCHCRCSTQSYDIVTFLPSIYCPQHHGHQALSHMPSKSLCDSHTHHLHTFTLMMAFPSSFNHPTLPASSTKSNRQALPAFPG
jgi:hypothetical protein